MYPSRSVKNEYRKSNVVYAEESEKVVREIVIQSFNVWKKMSERYRDSSIQIFGYSVECTQAVLEKQSF